MIINNRKIGRMHPPYIIAEMSANHNGKIENAYKIISMAKRAGADAVKLQTYTADTLTINSQRSDFMINDGLWRGQSLHDLYSTAHLPWNWHQKLFNYAKEKGITIFSSPFDQSAVELLEGLQAPAYKIASFEAIDLPLIRSVASTKKPVIISTGMANKDEIGDALEAARSAGCSSLALLHCVSGYPAPASDYNLATLVDMARSFDVHVGLSDHTIENSVAVASVALGASLIEKHVTLNRRGGGPDDSFSLEEDGLRELCTTTQLTWKSLGKVDYGLKSSERENKKFRRSLYFVKEVKKGEIITAETVRSIRPGYGIAPNYIDEIIGQSALADHSVGDRVDTRYMENLKK